MERHSERISDLKIEMDEATTSVETLRQAITDLRQTGLEVPPEMHCSSCDKKVTTRQFYLFPCAHAFHADCLVSKVLKMSSPRIIRRIMDTQKRMTVKLESSGGVLSKGIEEIRAELDTLVATDCALCGDLMINTVDVPLIENNDKEAFSWLI